MRAAALAILLSILALPGQARAQADPFGGSFRTPDAGVSWTAAVAPAAARPGEAVELKIAGDIGEGWKMYALDSPAGRPLSLRLLALPAGVTQEGRTGQSAPREGYDPNFEADVRYHAGKVELRARLRVGREAAPGAHVVRAAVTFMVCNDRLCLPPKTDTLAAALRIEAALPGAAVSPQPEPPAAADSAAAPAPIERAPPQQGGEVLATAELDRARAGGLWGFLLLAMGAGLAALLTPCVFPMVPLTVSYFTHHAGDRRAAVRMALVYGAAIVLTFTGLGVLTALLTGAAGAQTIAANPWINLFIGLVFVVFALSLLGLFELRLPSAVLNFVNRQGTERKGYAGVLFMGLTLTLVSFSCTVPFVGGLLAATARQEWSWPVLGMAVFSATFALPFVLFALFPGGLAALPRSGSWMNSLKVVLGFVELAAAFKFLSNADLVWGWGLLSRPLVIACWIAIFLTAGLYLLGRVRLLHEEPADRIGALRLAAAIPFLALPFYLFPGLLGSPLNRLDAYLPPRQATDVGLVGLISTHDPESAAEGGLEWHEEAEDAFRQAALAQRPVFIDFTGYTCTNCRQMEANVFPRPEVAERLRADYVLLRLYTDDAQRGPELQRYQLRLTGTVALPTYAVVSPDGELVGQWSGLASVEEFASFLASGTLEFRRAYLAAR